MTRVALLGASISGNKGAEAMARAAVAQLASRIPDAWFDLYTVYPTDDSQENRDSRLRIVACKPAHMMGCLFPAALLWRLGVRVLRRPSTLKGLLSADLVVDLSGISFVDGRGILILYNAIMTAIPLLLGCKTIRYAQAMGPFQHFWNRMLASVLLSRIDAVVARGHITAAHLKQIGLDSVPVFADAAFSMPVGEAAEETVQKLLPVGASRRVGISPSAVVDRYCRKHGIAYADIIAGYMDWLVTECRLQPVLFAHSARRNLRFEKNNDRLICGRVWSRVQRRDACLWIQEILSAEALRVLIRQMDFVATSRFHAMVASLAESVPPILIGWSHKYQEVLDMFLLKEWSIDFSELTSATLENKTHDLIGVRSEVVKQIRTSLPGVKRKAEANADLALAVLRRTG
ncbi:MAG TPA: hypothetical protein ENN17_05975 [bacterium]|nr:hypothetical protein [bacterium]